MLGMPKNQKLSWPLRSSESKQREGLLNPRGSEDPARVWGTEVERESSDPTWGLQGGFAGGGDLMRYDRDFTACVRSLDMASSIQ